MQNKVLTIITSLRSFFFFFPAGMESKGEESEEEKQRAKQLGEAAWDTSGRAPRLG